MRQRHSNYKQDTLGAQLCPSAASAPLVVLLCYAIQTHFDANRLRTEKITTRGFASNAVWFTRKLCCFGDHGWMEQVASFKSS